MVDCIWKVAEEDRHCEYCSYAEGCEKRPVRRVNLKEYYIDSMSKILGSDMLTRCRDAEYVWARYIVSYQMSIDGYSRSVIGKLMGLDHSTITHGIRKIEEMLAHPCFYVKENKIWKKYREALSL